MTNPVQPERSKADDDDLARRCDLLEEVGRMTKVGGWELNLTTMELIWSRETYRIHEIDPDVVPTVSMALDFFSAQHRPRLESMVQAAIESGTPWDFELPMNTAKGRPIWVRGQGAAVIREGKAIALRGAFQDITARKRAEENLSLFRTLVDQSTDAIEVVDSETGRFLDVNERGCCDLGYSREELLALRVFDIDPLVDPSAFATVIAELRKTGSLVWQGIHRRKDGSTFPVEVHLKLVRLDRDYLVSVVRDITERRRAETDRERLSTAIEQAAEAIIVTDTQGTILYVNPAFETVTGYRREEVIGGNPRLLKSGIHDDAFYRRLWETISGGETWRGRILNKRRDGTLYSEDASISPVRDTVGVITSYVAVKRDVTHELALEAQLFQSNKMEAIGSLAGGVAHDFNNLLLVILSYLDFALEAVREVDPMRDDLLEAKRAGERAATLTRQLLAFGRKQVLQPVPLNLNHVAGEIETMLRRILGEDIAYVQDLASDLGVVRADPAQIEQVLMNLVVNARDAMPEGGKLEIQTANVLLDEETASRHLAMTSGVYVALLVTDSGCGMDEHVKAHLFEPFFTTKERNRGTGLGLATVYGIVKQSGGHIWVDSEPGKGTTFRIYFPREVADSPAAYIKAPSVRPRVTGSETILVVEDEVSLLKVARRTLECSGYRVLTAAAGDAAQKISDEYAGDIHLLLTDVVMPRMSGKVLAQRLLRTRPTLKVIYMSGYTDSAIVHHGVLDAGTDFLAKPFAADALARKVREVLDRNGAPGEGT